MAVEQTKIEIARTSQITAASVEGLVDDDRCEVEERGRDLGGTTPSRSFSSQERYYKISGTSVPRSLIKRMAMLLSKMISGSGRTIFRV